MVIFDDYGERKPAVEAYDDFVRTSKPRYKFYWKVESGIFDCAMVLKDWFDALATGQA